MAGTDRRDRAEAGGERDDHWHRREYLRRLHQNRERGLASGPVPTLAEIERRERGPVSPWLQPRRAADDVARANQARSRGKRRTLAALAIALALITAGLGLWSRGAGSTAGLDGRDAVPLRQ